MRDLLPTRFRAIHPAQVHFVATTIQYHALCRSTSDAIPVHLLTRQALRLYLDKLTPHGVLAFHLTNGHLNLDPVVFNLALDAGVTYRLRKDLNTTLSDFEMGKMGSVWAVIARTPADLGPLADDPNWLLPSARPKLAVWTDDFSSLLSVYVWQ